MSPKIPMISIVVLNYNGLKYLKKTIPPLLKFRYPKYQIIVVDNASTDGSGKFLSKFGKLLVIKNRRNYGYSIGKNIGIKASSGEYILLLDNDILIEDRNFLDILFNKLNDSICFLQPFFLEKPKYLNETAYYGMFASRYGKDVNLRAIEVKDLKEKFNLIDIMAPNGACYFFKKSKFVRLGYFDESQEHNIDCYDVGVRAWLYGYKNKLITEVSVLHLGYKNSDSITEYIRRIKLLFSGNARIIIKNYRWRNILFTLPMFFFFQLFKSIRYSLIRRDVRVFLAFVSSVSLFF